MKRKPPPADAPAFDPSTRVLPHDLDAEKALLGSILVAGNAGLLKVMPLITPTDFFRRAHQILFSCMVTLETRSVEIDLVTLLAEVRAFGELDEVGGAAYISSLTDGVPRSANVAHYAGLVRDQAVRRVVIHTANRMLADAYDQKKPSVEIITEADRSVVELQRGDLGAFVTVGDTASDEYHAIEHAVDNRGKLTGITSGFKSIDEMTHGWQAGDLIAICARPSIGKTVIALNMAVSASEDGKHAAVFSLEMRRRQLQKRLLAQLSGVPMNLLLSGFLGENDYARLATAMDRYTQLKIHVNDRGHQTVWDIRSSCRLLKAQGKLDIVIVDYFQLMTGALEDRETRNAQLSDASRRLKVLADEVQCPVVLLSQLNRDAANRSDKRPVLSDIRDTGALEQDADIVAFLHRKHHRENGITQFIVEKQRNGPGGTVNLSIRRDTQTFEDGGVEPEQPALSPAPEEDKPTRRWRGGRPGSSW